MQPDIDLAGIILAATCWAVAWTVLAWCVEWSGFTGLDLPKRTEADPKE